MEEQAKVRVWLKAIEYNGGNVGSDTEFAVAVNGETIRIRSNMKVGTKKVFDKPLLTYPAQESEAKIIISVTVIETDVLFSDVGKNETQHIMRRGQPREPLPVLTVAVQENRGILGTGSTATFVLHFEAEFLATGTVTACCWNGISDKTRTLASYYSQSQRHRRMADYIAGACAYFNLQAAVGHAIGAIEDGVSKPKNWEPKRSPSANWMQLSRDVIEDEFIQYWRTNNGTGTADPVPDDVFRFDTLNAAAGIWYLTTRLPGEFGDQGISYKTAMYKAMQYNWGPEIGWPLDKAECKPKKWRGDFKPSAYAWTMAFLAWGNGYAVSDVRYTSQYSQYAGPPTTGGQAWTLQDKRLSPLLDPCIREAQLTMPEFTVTYAPQLTPYGRRSQRQRPRERQIVILVRRTSENTDHDYIGALAVSLHIAKAFRSGVAPMDTADTYFACESMKQSTSGKAVCVIVLGMEAKRDVEIVFPDATAYPSFASWQAGTADGYINSALSDDYLANYRVALREAVAAYQAGY